MSDSAFRVQSPPRLPRAAVALCLFTALTYTGMVLVDSEYVARHGAGTVLGAVLDVLIFLQMAAVTVTACFPHGVLAVVTVADLIILTVSDRSGLGSIAVMVVIRYLVRYRIPSWKPALIGCVAFFLVFVAGEIQSGQRGIIASAVLVTAGLVQRYLLVVVAAEYLLGRERLHQALRDKAELLEREKRLLEQQKRERVGRAPRASRDALARDLHDIAGHHLSGVIVSAPRWPRLCGTRTRIAPTRRSRQCGTVPEPLWPICVRSLGYRVARTAAALNVKARLRTVSWASRRRRAWGRHPSRRL